MLAQKTAAVRGYRPGEKSNTLTPGRNTLKVAAKGVSPSGTSVSDADKLVFIVR